MRNAVSFLRDAWPAICLALLLIAIPEAINIPAYVKSYRREATRASLDRKLPEFRADEKPLQEVLWELDRELDGRMDIDWHALEEAGLHRTTPVTVILRSVRVSKILNVIASEFERGHLAWWQTDSGRIGISTERQRQLQPTTIKRYDVRAVVLQPSDCFDPEPRDPRIGYTDKEMGEQVVLLVRDTVDTNSWKENGGLMGSVTYDNGYLNILQCDENQRAIEVLLEQLLQTRSTSIEGFFQQQRPK